MLSAAPQDHRGGPPCALPGNLVAMATGRQPPQVQRVGACRVQGDITLDHCGCLCCAFLPHLKGSGPPGAQVGKCPAGSGSGGAKDAALWQNWQGSSRGVPLQIQPVVLGDMGDPWDVEHRNRRIIL